ncbi:hypothetical protein ACETU7_14305 [Rhodococcus sp. 3Y1]
MWFGIDRGAASVIDRDGKAPPLELDGLLAASSFELQETSAVPTRATTATDVSLVQRPRLFNDFGGRSSRLRGSFQH